MRREQGTAGIKGAGMVALTVIVIVVGIVGAGFAGRWLADRIAARAYALADGHEPVAVGLAMALPLVGLVTGLVLLRRARAGRVLRGTAIGLIAVVVATAFGFLPGKNDDGRRASDFDDAIGTLGAGELFVGSGWALAPALLVTTWLVLGALPERGTRGQSLAEPERAKRPGDTRVGWVVRGLVLLVIWVGLAALVVRLVDAPAPRSSWLTGTAQHLREGEDFFSDWDPGLASDVADVVSCSDAADALELDGARPELDGCRDALLVHAVGRYGEDRAVSGELTAVVLRVGSVEQLDDLRSALDGVSLVAAHGLPAVTGEPLVTRAEAALSLVVAIEDSGTIPHPDEGAEAVPLTRALAWTLIGEAQGFHLIPG